MARRFSIKEIGAFVVNYNVFIRLFPNAIASLIQHSERLEDKVEYAKTLYSELGYGDASKVHSNLFDLFVGELAERMGCPGELSDSSLNGSYPILGTTYEFVEGTARLYADDRRTVAAGAHMALEWQAYTMVRKLYEGARNYIDLWPTRDGFYEACQYFYAHIAEAEKDHKEESLNGALCYAANDECVAEIRLGYEEHLRLIGRFWNGIYQELRRIGEAS